MESRCRQAPRPVGAPGESLPPRPHRPGLRPCSLALAPSPSSRPALGRFLSDSASPLPSRDFLLLWSARPLPSLRATRVPSCPAGALTHEHTPSGSDEGCTVTAGGRAPQEGVRRDGSFRAEEGESPRPFPASGGGRQSSVPPGWQPRPLPLVTGCVTVFLPLFV